MSKQKKLTKKTTFDKTNISVTKQGAKGNFMYEAKLRAYVLPSDSDPELSELAMDTIFGGPFMEKVQQEFVKEFERLVQISNE